MLASLTSVVDRHITNVESAEMSSFLGKLVGHRLLDWSFYALILVFPVIWYFILGSWFKSQLGSLVSGVKGLLREWVPISRKKKRCSHHEGHTRAKAKDRVWRWRR